MRPALAAVVLMAALLAGCSANPPVAPSTDPSAGTSESVIAIDGTFRPELSWPDLGAAHYLVGIVSDSGASWSWEGEDHSVIVGGVPEIDWVGPGFAIEGAAELTFAAFAADGSLLHLERSDIGG